MKELGACLLFLIGASCAIAQVIPDSTRQTAEKLRDAAMKGTGAASIVRSLSDDVGARLSGSEGSRRAVVWAVAKLTELGFENVRAEAVKVPHWERGIETGEVISPYPQKLVLTALGGSVATPSGGLEGEIVEVGSIESLKKLIADRPDAVRGRIVFFNKKMVRERTGKGYGDAVDVRVAGSVEAAKGGAVGVLIRTVGTADARAPHTGVMLYDSKTPKIPAAALSLPDADLLERLVAEGKPVRVRITLGCRTLSDADGANVIGDVRGSEKPEEIVLLGAHLDSWDLGTGALDDGAGIGIITEAARIISKLPKHPKRTVRVVLFANEENGSAGSAGYALAHQEELARHIAATELDLGTDRIYEISSLAAPEAKEAIAALAALLKPIGVENSSAEGHAGADINRLRTAGVPLFGLHQDASTYFDYHHSADDTFDKINAGNLDQCVAATATFAFVAADMPGDFGRVPEEKRKDKE